MNLVKRVEPYTNCKRCLVHRKAGFVMESDDGTEREVLCGYHYGKERGYIQ